MSCARCSYEHAPMQQGEHCLCIDCYARHRTEFMAALRTAAENSDKWGRALKCNWCGKPLEKGKTKPRKFCGTSCAGKWRRQQEKQEQTNG